MDSLNGKTIIVTGGGCGIGKGIITRFASRKARVVIADINETEGNNTAKMVKSSGGEALFVKTDVASEQSVQQCVEQAVDVYGSIDYLVNNAAISQGLSFLETPVELWRKTIDINLTGVFLMSRAVVKWMIDHHVSGSIVNMASINSFFAEKNACPYVSSKGGVHMLTKSMAVDLAPYRIRVNAVAPGPIVTEYNKAVFEEEPLQTTLPKNMLADGPGTPNDVAEAVEFLLIGQSGFINGTTLIVDGGFLAYARMD